VRWPDHRKALTQELGARSGGEGLAALLRVLCAPPNLRYLKVILQRVELLAGIGQTWGHLPQPIGDLSLVREALVWIDAPAVEMDPLLRNEWSEVPRGRGRARVSPLHGYCVSEFPIWSSLLVQSHSSATFFNDLCSQVIGEMIGASCKHTNDRAYKDFCEAWQERRDTPSRSGVVRPNHPYGSRQSTFCSIEQALRALSLPEHGPSWILLEESGDNADLVLGDPSLYPGIEESTQQYLSQLSNLLDRLNLDSSRGGRRFSGLLRSGHLHKVGRGCFVYQLHWIYETAETSVEDSGLTLLSEIDRKSAVGRLSQDFALEELASPTGVAAYAASEEETNLLTPALAVRTKWHYQLAQSVNQLPRWTQKALTGRQLAAFLYAIFNPKIDYVIDSDQILLSKLIQAASFATGLERKTLVEHLGIHDWTRATISNRVEYRIRDRHFRVAVNLPDLVVADSQVDGARQISNFICIPDRVGFHFLAEEWLRRNDGKGARILENENGGGSGTSLRPTELDREIEQMGIRPAQIAQALPRAVFDLTGDLASIALWGDWEPVHTRTIRHYLSPSSGAIEKSIDQALLGLIRQAKLSHGSGVSSRELMRYVDDVPARPRPRPIGAPKCPDRQQVKDLCASYQERLANSPDGSMSSIVAYSNAYIAYAAFHMSAALGYRAAIDPEQEFIQINGRTLALFSDKDSKGFHRRVLPVPTLFDAHRRHLNNHRRMMESLLPALKGKFDSLLFWIDGEKPKRFEPLRAERDAGALWPFRINALRRRMRTRLFERGAPGIATDVWMGHWNLGACPWMEGSGFEIGELWDLVDTHVEAILQEDGWTAIESLLVMDLAWAS